jgi:hypothetical protein
MAKVTRVFPYVNGRQIFTMPGGYATNVQYHCWGGGGGGGGDSGSQLGGNGSAGVYTSGEIFLNKGDQVEVVVAGGGQEGRSIDSNKKLFSMTLRGSDSISTGAWGYVNDPTQAVYPEYNNWASPRTSSAWNSFMNQWAVSDISQDNGGGEEEFSQPIYFPESGSYNIRMAADNLMTVWFRDNFLAQVDNNFNGSVRSESISVPNPGTYDLRYKLINSTSTSKDNNNPAGAAIVITKDQPGYMGGNGPNPVRGIIWSTRFGRSVDVTNRVPLYHAPLVPFYRPQRDNYDWGGFSDDKGLAFVSWDSAWSDDELAKLNLSFDKMIVLNYPVTIRGWGRVEQSISTGYYKFKRGQTWQQAQYAWSGNQKGTWETGAVYPNGVGKAANLNIAGAIDHGSGTPSCWNERSFSNGKKTYTESSPFANWELPVPGADEIYVVGFDDGPFFTSSNQRGSSDLTWQVNSVFSQTYAGGQGGYSLLNINNTGINYYGGYGGQIGDGKISGGGGGGGGASLILQRTARGTSLLTVAGGGAGGGGAGPKQFGDNGRNEYLTYTPYTNSASAGQAGANSTESGGGGGAGGGGQYGGKSGLAAIDGVGSRGDGGWQGGSQVTATGLEMPKADFVMIGRGANGGDGGGGGGAGELLTGQTKLVRKQYIQVGGRGEDKFEGGVSAIWYSDTDYIAAGPGGKGGEPGSQFSNTGNGQSGGCKNSDSNTNLWGGSGGGAGTRTIKATASGGPGKTWPKKPSSVTSYSNNGGNSSAAAAYAPGGGGGAGGAGQNGGTTTTASFQNGGNGGPGRSVTLGSTGKTYLLGGGGGAAAGYYKPGVQYVGLGGSGGAGDGNPGGGTNQMQWSVPGTYSFRVPRGVTSINVEGIGGGGAGGGGGQFGNGGGGAGGYLDGTAISVLSGQTVTVTIGRGGTNGNGGDTIIQFTSETITLSGGKQGSGYSGGAGGLPNGGQGEQGKNGDSPNWTSGAGAGSPFGEGGSGANTNNKTARPGNAGTGAGGGGGWSNSTATVNGGLGGAGLVKFSWDGVDSTRADSNSGSGGGGGFDGGGGEGGTGFVAIGYAGEPLFNFTGESLLIQQNGYTIHECYSSGELVYNTPQNEGSQDSGGGISPGGQGVNGFIVGSAVGGKGQGDTNVYPVPFTQGYTGFLNDYSVWNSDPRSSNFDRTYYVFVPETASYEFESSADNGGQVFVDDGLVLDMTPYNRDNGKYWSQNICRNTKTLTAGQHKIDIKAVNIGQVGAFGMKIVKSGTSNPLLFNSRKPPVIEGSATGGNGLVVLVFTGGEGTAQVKVNNAWKKLVGQWVKVDGAWKMITDSAVKVGGSWASLFGATPIAVSIDTNNFGGPSTPTVTTPTTPIVKPPDKPVDPGPDPLPPPVTTAWFIWAETFCVPPKWNAWMRTNAVWKDASECTFNAKLCKAPATTKSFSSSFLSNGGKFSFKCGADDACSFNLKQASTGKTLFSVTITGRTFESPTIREITGTLPAGLIDIVGSVSNANNGWEVNPAGLALEIYDGPPSSVSDPTGVTSEIVWSATQLVYGTATPAKAFAVNVKLLTGKVVATTKTISIRNT